MIQMHVSEIYKIRDRTIFSGIFSSNNLFVQGQTILLIMNQQEIAHITIEGFVNNHSNVIDIWTKDLVTLTQNDLTDNIIVLQSVDITI